MPGAAASNTGINAALQAFEATEANTLKLEGILAEIRTIAEGGGSDARYASLCRSARDIEAAIPPIDGWRLNARLLDLDYIQNSRDFGLEPEIEAPERALAEFRHRLAKLRRQLVRQALGERVSQIDATIERLRPTVPKEPDYQKKAAGRDWETLKTQILEVETLLGTALPRPPRWSDLSRHLRFGMENDLRDIVNLDWPEIRIGLDAGLYCDDEPIPVGVADLGALAATHPTGPIATRLAWERLSDEDFERLIFNLISNTNGYENPAWLTQTHAPDRGRDLSAERILTDALSGTTRQRVIIQCKHWQSRSIGPPEVTAARDAMPHWEPPPVDALVLVTSGRFTNDAVDLIERHNQADRRLRIEMWAESHLESLLAGRPELIAEFRLRGEAVI